MTKLYNERVISDIADYSQFASVKPLHVKYIFRIKGELEIIANKFYMQLI